VEPRAAITIGNFDGVHLGHRALLARARERVGDGGRVVVMGFDPHPAAALKPGAEPPMIEPFETRRERLLSAGADEVVRLEPTPELLGTEPEAFIERVRARHGASFVVEGHDFHFGRGRAGTPETLREMGERLGFGVDIVGPVAVPLTNQHIVTVSSSYIRRLITLGRVRDAAFMLGRAHELSGAVVRGDRLGRTIGIPTVNLATDALLPSDGVYSGRAAVEGAWIPCAVNIGARPTAGGTERRAEAHLLSPDGSPWTPPETLPEYGWACTIRLGGWVRDQVRFGSLDALRTQIGRDCARVLAMPSPVSTRRA